VPGPDGRLNHDLDPRDRGPQDACGVFGVWAPNEEVAKLTYFGLYALQHRGQEAAGIVSFDGAHFHSHRAVGLIGDIFGRRSVIDGLPGHAAIGHARYSTTGASMLRNVQPLFADFAFGGLAVAHNGNLTNATLLRRRLVDEGSLFQSTSDTEVIIHLIARSGRQTIVSRVVDALREVEGAWSLVAVFDDGILGGRDALGVRPLVLGRLDGAWILASETCALDILGAEFVRDVEPGEIVVIDGGGVRSLRPFADEPRRFCIFEYVYFSRPDSVVEGKGVYEVRKRIGAELARESGVPADVVVPVPDSGVPAAIGYAQEAGIGFELGIIRNHYVGRTFINPTQDHRVDNVKIKFNPVRDVIHGKSCVVVDDSLVRGNTSRSLVRMIRAAGAREVHLRLASPPITGPCHYGIDTPTREELIASSHSIEEIREFLGVDSLGYLSLDGMLNAAGSHTGFCHACFSGQYPTPIPEDLVQLRHASPLIPA
jgi:amidophosphoribosyltransferase